MTDNTLNPQIREIDYGVRSLRKLKIYPMSMSDQKKFGELFKKVVEEYLAQTPEGPMNQADLLPFASFIVKLVGENIKEILKIITELRDNELATFFDDVTNTQMSQIIMAVVEENFESPSKNLIGLWETVAQLFPLERLSLPFSSDMDNGTSATSTQEDSEKED